MAYILIYTEIIDDNDILFALIGWKVLFQLNLWSYGIDIIYDRKCWLASFLPSTLADSFQFKQNQRNIMIVDFKAFTFCNVLPYNVLNDLNRKR